MKHITLFEGWRQTEMDFKMTPEKFGKEVDKSLEMDTQSAVAHLADIFRSNPELKSDREAIAHMKRFHQKFGAELSGETPPAATAAPEISLEDWSALIQGFSGLPKDFASTLGSEVLTRVMKEIPSIKKDPSYMRELTKFSSVIKSSVGL